MKLTKYSSWLLLLLAAILPIALIVLYAIGLESFTDQEFTGEGLFTDPIFAIVIALSHTTMFLLLIYFLRKQGLTLANIGWKKGKPMVIIREVSLGVLLGFGLYLFKEFALDSLSAALTGHTPTFHSLFNFQFESKDIYLMSIAVIFPFVEESIFRGYPHQQWQHRWTPWKILLITSLLFGLMHVIGDGRGFTSGISAAILGGLYFGIFYWRKNLFANTAAHSFYNFLVVLT